MSSQVWKEFEKLMAADVLVKTAGTPDPDYNVVPEGSEECGWDLVELAHPDQVQVANSQNNDGIVENGVEAQKVMIDVALRNPRGVIVAELMSVLVKAANALEDDMTDESLEAAAEIDMFIEKVAQDVQSSDPRVYAANLGAAEDNWGNIYMAMNKAADALRKLDFGWFGGNRADKAMAANINQIAAKLEQYGALQSELSDPAQAPLLMKRTDEAIKYILSKQPVINTAIKMSSDVGMDSMIAKGEWLALVKIADNWGPYISQFVKQPGAKEQGMAATDPNKVKAPLIAPQKNSPAHKPVPAHNTIRVRGPKVEELQAAVGAGVDGKFGPETFRAVMSKAKDNYALRRFLQKAPEYAKGYGEWDDFAVEAALNMLRDFENKPEHKQEETSEVVNPYSADADRLMGDQTKRDEAINMSDFVDHMVEKYPNAKVDHSAMTMTLNGNKYSLKSPQMQAWMKKEMGWA